ncbi:hypothetical protein [Aeromonas phage AS-yj]|uniref:Uncharacterized protein n=1 Tax=Aeromonas phage AS-yj TaxID=2026115 RepID=A0A291LF50_9CAUD|nr:hypothetical protein [Aeromonas phage AS-yj]QAX98977.1 hypothetical protein assk_186 [Aeromonas phage Assk]
MTTMTVQFVFGTRSAARAASFGKMTDNGKDSTNRWGRSVTVNVEKKTPMTLTRTGRRGPSTQTTVVVKKMKTMVR